PPTHKPVSSPIAATVNSSLNPTTFLEGTHGHAQIELTGCVLAQGGTGPTFCQSAFPMNDIANLNSAGLASLPFLFTDAGLIDPSYYAFKALNSVKPPIWDGTRLRMAPAFTWGNPVSNANPNYAPPNVPFPGYINLNATNDVSISLTKVNGRHTMTGDRYTTQRNNAPHVPA